MEFVGAVTRLSHARESTYGTPPVVYSLSWGGAGGSETFCGITNQTATFPDPEIDMGQYASIGQQREGLFQVRDRKISLSAGSLPFLPTDGRFLYYGFGNDEVSAATGMAHYFSGRGTGAILPSFTMAAAFDGAPNFARFYTGCVVNSLSFGLSEAQELSCTSEYKANYVHTQSDISRITDFAAPTYQTAFGLPGTTPPDATPWMFYDVGATEVNFGGAYNRATGAITGGRSFARVTGFTARINNNLREKHYMRAKKALGAPFDNAQWPYNYLATRPSFELSIDVVPAGHTGGWDNTLKAPTEGTLPSDDELYDMLVNNIVGRTGADGRPMLLSNVVIPFQRVINGQTQTLHLIFKDCRISNASHSFNEDGSEPTVSVTVVPRSFHVRMVDGVAFSYNTIA